MQQTYRHLGLRFALSFSIASLSSFPLAVASIWFRGKFDVVCLHLILFSVSSATAVLFFGIRNPTSIVTCLVRLVVFQLILSVELADSYLFPYILGETGSENAVRLFVLVTAAMLQYLALILLLRWSTFLFSGSLATLPSSADNSLGQSCGISDQDANFKDLAVLPPGYSPTFDATLGFKFIYGPREHQWFDDLISPLDISSPTSGLGSQAGSALDSGLPTHETISIKSAPVPAASPACTCVHCSDLARTRTLKA